MALSSTPRVIACILIWRHSSSETSYAFEAVVILEYVYGWERNIIEEQQKDHLRDVLVRGNRICCVLVNNSSRVCKS
jgi:hypothetical protein